MSRLSAAAGTTLAYFRPMSGDAHVLRLAERLPEQQVQMIADQLSALPEVQYAEPDQIERAAMIPTDPQYANQWDYYDTYGMNLPAAWDISSGASNVTVAVIDTGYRPHADLAGRFVSGYDFVSDILVANDGDGRDADASDPGDWITAAEDSSGFFAGCGAGDSSWHGTHVAGTIAANANNGLGVTGINWAASILPVRVLGKCGGYISDIADGMRWAAGISVPGVPANLHPAKVLNMSLGGSGSCSSTYQDAINAINATGSILVVAAGNSNADASGFRPANCTGVITVGATNRNGQRAAYSNYGAIVAVSAPGGQTYGHGDADGILSTLNAGTTVPGADSYAYYQGTSMATPHVAGLLSLMVSVSPTLNYASAAGVLKSSVRPFGPNNDCAAKKCGTGIVDAFAAMNAVRPTKPVTRRAMLPRMERGGTEAGPWTMISSLDFETGLNGWTTFDNNNPASGQYFWARRNCPAVSSGYVGWATGGGSIGSVLACGSNYANNVSSWLVYGPFSLAAASAGQLNFRLWLNSEPGYDGFSWLASTDGTHFNGLYLTGNSNGWITRTLDMAYAGSSGSVLGQPQVWVAFIFDSDESYNYAGGAYIDNVVIRKCAAAACVGGLATGALPDTGKLEGATILPASRTLRRAP